jgi:hypothetical protein
VTERPFSVPTRILQGAIARPGANEKSSFAIFALLLALFICVRLWRLTSYGLFGDEVFSVWAVVSTWRDMFACVVEDVVHPPLFYMLLKFWADVGGTSLLWLKLFPALTSIISIWFLLLLCRELKLSAKAVKLAFFLFSINAYLIGYAQELRMYSLLLLLTLSSLWLFAKFLQSSSGPILPALFSVNLLLIYTHYYGWLVVGTELLLLLFYNRQKALSFSLALAILAACFIPWAYLVTRAAIKKGGLAPNLFWNTKPKLANLASYYGNLIGAFWFNLGPCEAIFEMLLFNYPALLWTCHTLRSRNREQALVFQLLLIFSSFPVIASFLLSHALPYSIWGARYLIIAAPTYMILIANAALRLRIGWLRKTTVFLIIALAGLSGIVELSHRDKISYEPLVQKMIEAEPARSTITRIYTDEGNLGNTIEFYLDNAGETGFQIVYVDDFTWLEGDHFWVAHLKYKRDTRPLPQSTLAESGFRIGEVIASEAAGHEVFLFPVWRR